MRAAQAEKLGLALNALMKASFRSAVKGNFIFPNLLSMGVLNPVLSSNLKYPGANSLVSIYCHVYTSSLIFLQALFFKDKKIPASFGSGNERLRRAIASRSLGSYSSFNLEHLAQSPLALLKSIFLSTRLSHLRQNVNWIGHSFSLISLRVGSIRRRASFQFKTY